MSFPKVTIIMITYNHEKYLSEAIDSVLNQKFEYDYELLIGEDKSPDNSRQILKKYESMYPGKIKVFYRQENMGPIKNFYDMFLKATGEYIVYLEGDDYWTDDYKLQKQVDFLDGNNNFFGCFHIINDILGEKLLTTYPSKKLLDDGVCDVVDSPGKLLDMIRTSNFKGTIHINSIMFRNKIDFTDEKIKSLITDAKMIADLQLEVIILSHGSLKLLRETMGVHRRIVEENGTSFSSKKVRFVYEDYSKVLRNIRDYLGDRFKSQAQAIIEVYDQASVARAIYTKDFGLAKIILNKMTILSKIKTIFIFIFSSFKKILNYKSI